MENLDFFPVGRQWRMPLWIGLLLAVISVDAAELDVTVLDRYGRLVPNVAVFVQSDPEIRLPVPRELAVMELVDTRFAPNVLVVQAGSSVQTMISSHITSIHFLSRTTLYSRCSKETRNHRSHSVMPVWLRLAATSTTTWLAIFLSCIARYSARPASRGRRD